MQKPWLHELSVNLTYGFAVFFLYFLGAELGHYLSVKPQDFATFWPPNGILMGALLISPRSRWWTLFAGAALANLSSDIGFHDKTFGVSAALTLANAAECFCGVWLINRFANVGNDSILGSLRGTFTFFIGAVLLAPMVGATLGATVISKTFSAPFFPTWLTWYCCDAVGVAVAAPIAVAWARPLKVGTGPLLTRCREALAMFSLFAIFLTFLCLVHSRTLHTIHPEFILIPFLLWSTLRVGTRATTMMQFLAAVATLCNMLPLVGLLETTQWEKQIIVSGFQLRVTVLAGSVYLLSAVINERQRLQKRVESNLERMYNAEHAARAQAEAIINLRDNFLATVSHELRTPLTAIVGWVGLLQQKILGEKQHDEAVDTIAKCAETELRLVNDILDFSRLAKGKIQLHCLTVDIRDLAAEVMRAGDITAKEKNITLVSSFPPDPVLLDVDPQRMQEVLWNLLGNALKFTPDNGRIEIVVSQTKTRVIVAVQDTGCGISPDFLPYVFEQFMQADSSPTKPHTGLGLGLTIVKQIVELHGGNVRAESEGQGKGARFTLELPLSKSVLSSPQSIALAHS